MKLLRKLVPTMCLLLVSAVLLGTSTYAWFSMNTTVQATGMQVQATSSKNLVISSNATLKSDESNTATSAYSGTVTMTPASVQTLAGSQNFFYASNSTGVNYNSGKGGIGTIFAAATPKTDSSATSAEVVKHTFYIRVDGQSSDTLTNLHVSEITVQGADTQLKDISKALRVGVVCGTNGYIYAPVSGATATYNAINKAGTVATVTDGIYYDSSSAALNASTTALTAYTNANVLAASVGSATYTEVNIYIWYEGEDAACTSVNSVNVETLNISVAFTAA